MIGPVEEALKAELAKVTTWPVRWKNERWDDEVLLSDGDMPIDTFGLPLPAIEAEVVGGEQEGFVGYDAATSRRKYRRLGSFRMFLSVGQGTGTEIISNQADTLALAFSRKTVFHSPLTSRRLITMDVRVDDGVASYEEGNRFVRMLSAIWVFDFVM